MDLIFGERKELHCHRQLHDAIFEVVVGDMYGTIPPRSKCFIEEKKQRSQLSLGQFVRRIYISYDRRVYSLQVFDSFFADDEKVCRTEIIGLRHFSQEFGI